MIDAITDDETHPAHPIQYTSTCPTCTSTCKCTYTVHKSGYNINIIKRLSLSQHRRRRVDEFVIFSSSLVFSLSSSLPLSLSPSLSLSLSPFTEDRPRILCAAWSPHDPRTALQSPSLWLWLWLCPRWSRSAASLAGEISAMMGTREVFYFSSETAQEGEVAAHRAKPARLATSPSS